MQPHAAERRHLDRQITYARPIFMVLALGVLLEEPPQARGTSTVAFILGYLGAALALLAVEHVVRLRRLAGSAAGGSGGALRFSCC